MKVLHIQVFSKSYEANSSIPLAHASDLSSFSFYQKTSIQEFLNFFSATVSNKTQAGQRQSIKEQAYTFHVYCIPNSGDLAGVIVTDDEYPVRVAFGLLNKITDEFQESFPKERYEKDVIKARSSGSSSGSSYKEMEWPALGTYLAKYQDPKQADTIMRVQQELDETKIVLHKTIESVLERGEKLDSLVDRSNALSAQSKMFYKTAKKVVELT
ncbi:MAG: palmitoyltransferase [Cyphobasidiales sp. Tagirdzhanova-0007]|nr:MAG: palmitoyltransferase [Cyphobasidiales sp. Tagirdzhanova-0007]